MASTKRARDKEMRDDLRGAIARGELVAHYQPIVDLRSGALTRLEALARWPHPELGWVEPTDFVRIAERNGLISPLRRLMRERAIADLGPWRRRVPWLRVALNVSALSLERPNFPDELLKGLDEQGASPDWFSLELTESLLLRDPDTTVAHVRRLRAVGVRVDIDDFGSGYSSLKHLRLMRVDSLKIDRQFVVAAREEPASETIVRAVIHLCHDLGMEAVAEGVETQETLETLQALGCDSAQGFYLGAPRPAGEIDALLEGWTDHARGLGLEARRTGTEAGGHILVVDDEPAILELVGDVLRDNGYRVETASNGLEALGAVQSRRPALVLLDVRMPILDGAEFVHELRQRRIDVPILIMSAGPTADRWATMLGVEGSVAKPFRIADLVAAASRFMPTPAAVH